LDKFKFWQNWLFYASIFIAVYGALFAILNQPFVDFVYFNKVDPVFWGNKILSEEIILFQKWIYGVLGSVVLGWGIFFAFIAYYPFKNKEKWSWNCIAVGMLLWFLFDSTISIYFKVFINAGFNIVFFLLAGLPLLFTKKYFN
jgi:hypothetical protein